MDLAYRLPASLRPNSIGMALCLCLPLLLTGCGQSLLTKGDDVPLANPMLNANYSDDAEVPFVKESKGTTSGSYRRANFQSESASRRTRDMANWVVSSGDNQNMPFSIVDKVNAKVYVFDANGQLRGAAPALLGMAKGDRDLPGVGKKPMSRMSPSERMTPAGRFVSAMGRNLHGKEILWLDYENSLSMHPVVTTRPKERRVQRLASPTPSDNRISFGCINVPPEFFKDVVHPVFSGVVGVVYVLPEDKQAKKS